MLNQKFTKPRLCKSKDGIWYVHFSYLGKIKKYKKGINYLKNPKEKEIFGNALVNDLHEKLKKGWNPFVSEEVPQDDIYFASALEFALKEKKERLADKSFSTYKNTLVHILKAIKSLGLQYVKIQDVKRYHIRAVLKKVRTTRSLSNHARNKYLSQLSAIMSELLDHDIIEYNPCHKIKPLPVGESNANETATDSEHEIIKKELETNHPNFCKFIETVYHTGIRPKEILSIQLHMINLEIREIILPPIITKSGTRKRNVVINNYMLDMLLNLRIDAYPDNFYLFGSFRKSGCGNRGKFDDFIIGPTQLKRDTATKRWQKIVKKGLGINVNMYSYKHKGGDDKLLSGVDLDAIRELYGHSSKRMTSHYVKRIKGIYKKDIIDNSPKF
jgi:integrase